MIGFISVLSLEEKEKNMSIRSIYSILLSVVLVLSGISLHGSVNNVSKKQILDAARKYRKANEHKIIAEYFELLSIPNVSSDRQNVRKNAEFIREMLEKRGIPARLIETVGNPVVYGEKLVPGASQTLMFYVHYDGQPVDPSKWIDSKPFKPVIRPAKMEAGTDMPKPVPLPALSERFGKDWRIYARSTSDDKAPLISIMAALDALTEANIPIKNNLKFIFEGEEEAGSTNLRPFLEKHKDLLGADVLFMCDGPAYYSGDPTIFFGVRGLLDVEIKVYGPNTNLHSGHYGNWAPNPAIRLARLLTSMKDKTGRVMINGFYDTVVPLTDTEKQAIKTIPSYEKQIKENYGFIHTEGSGISLMDAIQFPSLNIRGLESGWVGSKARTIIPADATASIDIRLVKGCDPGYMLEKVKTHVQDQGYFITSDEPDNSLRMKHAFIAKITTGSGYNAYRTTMNSSVAKRLVDALTDYYEQRPVLLPTLGGSLPIYLFDDVLNIPVIGISIANHDNNQHQSNENIRIGNLWAGIETFAAVIMMK